MFFEIFLLGFIYPKKKGKVGSFFKGKGTQKSGDFFGFSGLKGIFGIETFRQLEKGPKLD